jgi:hypothetical protein
MACGPFMDPVFELQGLRHLQLLWDIVRWGDKSHVTVTDTEPTAELHKSIESAVPELIGLLTDGDADVRAAGTEALLTLAKYGAYKQCLSFAEVAVKLLTRFKS